MDGETVTILEEWDLAYGKKAVLKDVAYESGMRLLRMTVREGKRITDVNFHPEAAREIAAMMNTWAGNQSES